MKISEKRQITTRDLTTREIKTRDSTTRDSTTRDLKSHTYGTFQCRSHATGLSAMLLNSPLSTWQLNMPGNFSPLMSSPILGDQLVVIFDT